MLFPLSLPQMWKSHFSFNVKLFLNFFWRRRNSPFQEQFYWINWIMLPNQATHYWLRCALHEVQWEAPHGTFVKSKRRRIPRVPGIPPRYQPQHTPHAHNVSQKPPEPHAPVDLHFSADKLQSKYCRYLMFSKEMLSRCGHCCSEGCFALPRCLFSPDEIPFLLCLWTLISSWERLAMQ